MKTPDPRLHNFTAKRGLILKMMELWGLKFGGARTVQIHEQKTSNNQSRDMNLPGEIVKKKVKYL